MRASGLFICISGKREFRDFTAYRDPPSSGDGSLQTKRGKGYPEKSDERNSFAGSKAGSLRDEAKCIIRSSSLVPHEGSVKGQNEPQKRIMRESVRVSPKLRIRGSR